MRIVRYITLLLLCILGTDVWGQYNPASPDEPGAAPWKLTLKSVPAGVGKFRNNALSNWVTGSSVTSWADGSAVTVRASNNGSYIFMRWEEENGTELSSSTSYTLTMPAANKVLVARYTYNPNSPTEPAASTTELYHLYGMRENGTPGSTINYPVYLENTGSATGFSIDLTFPEGLTVDANNASLTDRTSGHTVEVVALENNAYRFYVRGSEAMAGANGKVLEVPLTIPADNDLIGTIYDIGLSQGVIFKADGSQTSITVRSGSLKIERSPDVIPDGPDFTVSDIAVAETETGPGELIHLSWKVNNVGTLEAASGWSERIYLVDANGKKVSIGNTHYETTALEAGGSVSREADIALSRLLGIEGGVYVSITIVPNAAAGEIAERQSNNTTDNRGSTIQVGKTLYLTVPATTLVEGETTTAKCQLARSGDWTVSEVFNLNVVAGDGRLTVPTTVTIPKNQSSVYFYVTVENNSQLDDNRQFTIQASGNGYAAVTGDVTIEDDELPEITLMSSKSEVNEGETFRLTVTLPRVATTDVSVMLTAEYPKRFTMASSVTIPAGQTSAEVTVTVNNDDTPSLQLSNAFTASAEGYTNGETIVILNDDDIPALELTLIPNCVSEGAGVASVAGVLRRTGKTDNKITVKLTDNANGGLYFGNRTLQLAKGVEEIHFNFGPVDNANVDGDRTYTVTAAVWVSSCNCSASGESAGSVSANLEVFDDDGATLSVTSSTSTVKEGGKTTLTIKRNTATTAALTVTLSSDYDDNLTYQHSVTIPADQQSVGVEVTSMSNGVSNDSHTVVFTVAASGYSSGTCYLMITDQTLPDARISSLTADKQEATVSEEAGLTLVVANVGAAELPAGVAVKVYRRGESTAVTTLYTKSAIAVGGSETLPKSIVLPATVGSHRYYAVVNEAHKVSELLYTNNTSAEAVINTIAPFTVTVNTDKSVYKQGEKVTITGQLTGKNTAETDIDLYVINEGTRHVKTVKTDAQGAFTYEWELYALQAGHFSVGACYPDEGLKTEMAAFDVYGLRRTSNNNITCEPLVNEAYTGSIQLYNPGVLSLTNVHVVVLEKPEHITATFTGIENMAGGSKKALNFTLNSEEVSPVNQWEEVKIRIVADEGPKMDMTLYYHNTTPHAALKTDIAKINATMLVGGSREYVFYVTNTGKGETGIITLGLPSWMSSATGSTIGTLQYGESTQITLTFTPNAEMQVNVPITGYISINCEHGNGITLPYSVKPVSDSNGTMVVDVTDEYSYLTEEKPHVKGAHVKVKQPVTNQLVVEGDTGADGLFTVELPAGYYSVVVNADRHDSYSSSIMVEPGTETPVDVFLGFQAVTYSWNVVETGVEDEYEIQTNVEYETRVPAPVVEVIFPESLTYQDQIINIVATNKGLISAYNVFVDVPTDKDGATYEVMVPLPIDTLKPQTSVVIPIRMTVNSDEVYESLSAVTYGGTYYGDGAAEENGTQAGTRAKRSPSESLSSLCWKTTITLYHDRRVCNKETGNWDVVGKDAYSRTYYFGNCTGKNNNWSGYDWIPTSTPSWIPTYTPKPASPTPKPTQVTHPTENTNKVMQVFDGCTTECTDKVANAVLSCTFAIPSCIPMTGAAASAIKLLSCLGGYAVGCQNILLLRDLSTNTVIDCTLGIMGCSVKAGLACLAGIDGCLKSSCDAYIECHKNRSRARAASSSSLSISPDNYEGINLIYKVDSLAIKKLYEVLGNGDWDNVTGEELETIQDYLWKYMDDGSLEFSEDRYEYKPASLTEADFDTFLHRIDNSLKKEKDSSLQFDNYINLNVISDIEEQIATIDTEIKSMGYEGIRELSDSVASHFGYLIRRAEENRNNSVCASISLQFNQTMVMTRQAFRGKLTVFNGHETTAMTNVKLTLNVTSSDGKVATAHEFQMNAESLNGFTGNLNLTDGWTLAGNGTGTATILFIPTKYAAPTEPVDYSFGGTLRYVDPFTGLEVTRDLYPVTLTVNPSPELNLTYFMQRDIYGDDPLTLDVVEPTVPAEFALFINNIGNGDATNVRMVTQQPVIVDNEKGLNVDFEIVSSQVNGGKANLSFGKAIANDFGTIPAHSQAYAQWWLNSTLLGHFTEYDVTASHVTSYGNEDLSLLGDVSIHELIHSLDLSTNGSNMVGFLVNDIADAEDLPDMLYLSNGETKDVAIAASCQMTQTSSTTFTLNITPSASGWNYGSVADLTYGMSALKSIVRQSDGQEMNLRNFWQTDRTLRDGRDPLYEYRIHFADEFASQSPETYILTFEPMPSERLVVEQIDGIPEEGAVAFDPVVTLTVKFNKLIQPDTFTGEDIAFSVQGVRQDASLIGITTEDNRQFTLNLNNLNQQCGNGYYTMKVQAASVTDHEGFEGNGGKQVDWIMFRGGLVQLLTKAWPELSGTINRQPVGTGSGRRKAPAQTDENSAEYGSTVLLTATPNTGYEFSNWTMNGEVVSTHPQYEALAINDMDITANFTKKTYRVDIQNESEGGAIADVGTGIYEYGTQLQLTATPAEDYVFKRWNVNSETAQGSGNTLSLTVDKALDVKAEYEREFYHQSMTFVKGWNWVSSYLTEPLSVTDFSVNANRVVGQFEELINDPRYGMVGNLDELTAGKTYKVEAKRSFSTSFRGHLSDVTTSPLPLHAGWNWIAYPCQSQTQIGNVVVNAEEGDFIVSQTGFTEYADGCWEGSIDTFVPGAGYLYKSVSDKSLSLNLSATVSGSRAKEGRKATVTEQDVDIYHYPNTMNVTACISQDGKMLPADGYNIYAMAGEEIRGMSHQVGGKHYLTVYGDEPTDISFVVESVETGETFVADEVLPFQSEIVGCRKLPFTFSIGSANGIDTLFDDRHPMTVYSMQGVLISHEATIKSLHRLPKGVYIVNGQKCYIK